MSSLSADDIVKMIKEGAGNLPAFASKKAALQFAAQRGGTVLAYADVDAGLVTQLGGQGTHAH